MTDLSAIKKAFNDNQKLRDYFIQSIVEFERKAGYPFINVRDALSGPLCDELFGGSCFVKSLSNELKIKFIYNSKIAREFLLSDPAVPDHVWEPQTTKLLLHFSKEAKNVIIAGAYFGDQAILVADNIINSGICHTFEPNKNNSDLILENSKLNDLNNILINNLALWNKSYEKLIFEGKDALASTVLADQKEENVLHTITIDDYIKQNKVGFVNLIMIDVEGSEIKVLQGATKTLETQKPVVVFETHSLYNNWIKGLENSDSIKLMTALGYIVYAVRDFHQNINTEKMPIELLPVERTYCAIPPHHGFNLLAVPSISFVQNKLFRIVYDLSPKLLLHKNDQKFLPSKF